MVRRPGGLFYLPVCGQKRSLKSSNRWGGACAITIGEGGEQHRCPGCLAPVGRYSRCLTRVSLASFVMASSFPCCEIRQLLVHVYPGGSKAPGAERITVFYGRRGRPVKKPRFMPAELAHQWARKLQARRLGTVSVL